MDPYTSQEFFSIFFLKNDYCSSKTPRRAEDSETISIRIGPRDPFTVTLHAFYPKFYPVVKYGTEDINGRVSSRLREAKLENGLSGMHPWSILA